MVRFCNKILLLFVLTSGAGNLHSQGFVIPRESELAVPQLLQYRVSISIDHQFAKVEVEHEFYNPSQTDLNGVFYFPLRKEAVVSNFKFNTGRLQGENQLYDEEKASKIYEELLEVTFDRGLLEIMDMKLFSGEISLPAAKKRTIKLEYAELIDDEHSVFKLTHPLHTPLFSNKEWDDSLAESKEIPLSINVKIQSGIPIKTLYSPTHEIDVVRKNNNSVQVNFKSNLRKAIRDFILYYGTDDKELGVSLIAQRPESKTDGYFALLVSPDLNIPQNKILAKNLIFALDISNSMAGEKMKQAKAALKYCINHLNKDDYFNIIAFNSESKLFEKNLVKAGDRREGALDFIQGLNPRGGTNINEALLTALDMRGSNGAFRNIVFITDGLPTVGVTEIEAIRQNVQRLNQNGYRIFNFGIGYDVNTRLLDGIALDNFGNANYIEPGENIEKQISTFYQGIHNPIMSELKIDFGGIEVYDIYPQMLPDLFEGSQSIFFGRYKNWGRTVVTLTGHTADNSAPLLYDIIFPEVTEDKDYVARLWAMRKVGSLLERINLSGESKELKEQIVSLSKQFGLITPFTCYLIREESGFNRQPFLAELSTNLSGADGLGSFTSVFNGTVGKKAVVYSKSAQKLQEALTVDMDSRLRYVNGRTFVYEKEVWTDLEYEAAVSCLQIKYRSEAYLNLLRTYPDVADFLALGPRVVFKFNDKFIMINQDGNEKLTIEAIRQYYN